MSLMSLTAVELGKKIKAKEVTVAEAATGSSGCRLKQTEKERKHAYVTVDRRRCIKTCRGSTEKDR